MRMMLGFTLYALGVALVLIIFKRIERIVKRMPHF